MKTSLHDITNYMINYKDYWLTNVKTFPMYVIRMLIAMTILKRHCWII